jgi:copper homeostasis protein
MKYLLEVCIDSFESALNAQAGGADRVELCDNLYEGGTTPSIGMISMVRESLSIKLNVIIRPRGGDFLYSDAEYDIMKFDILKAKEAGADRLVFGLLLPGGLVDIERTRELVELARPMSVTFHRAFDMTPEPFKAIDDIISTGATEFHLTGKKKK